MKLAKNSLKNIEIGKIKTLLSENKDVFAFSDYFKDYVNNILKEENRNNFEIDDLDNFKSFLDGKKDYLNILKKYDYDYSKLDISYKLLDFLSKGKTLDEFESVLKDNKLLNVIKESKKDNLDYILDFCDNLDDLISYVKNLNFKERLRFKSLKNIKYVMNLLEVKNIKEFNKCIENDYIFRLLDCAKDGSIEYMFDFLKINKNNIESLSYNDSIIELMSIDKNILKHFIDILNISPYFYMLNIFYNNYFNLMKNIGNKGLSVLQTLDPEIQKNLIENIDLSILKKFDLNNIKNHKKGSDFGFFVESLKNGLDLSKVEFPINKDNFLDSMNDNDCLFDFIESKNKNGIWTKKWILEDKSRIDFINSKKTELLSNMGLIPGKGNLAISNFSANNPELWEELEKFISNKLIKSKKDIKIFTENQIMPSKEFDKIFSYYLKNKQKNLTKILYKLNFIELFDLDINVIFFKTIDDFKNEKGEIDYELLKNNFEKSLENISLENISKKLLKFDNFVSRKNIDGLTDFVNETFVIKFEKELNDQIKAELLKKISKVLGNQNVNINDIDNLKIDREEFVEVYKMSLNPQYNKEQFNKLLFDYLNGKFDNLEELNQYKTSKNIIWLNKNLTEKQQKIWLSKNSKEIVLDDCLIEENDLNTNIKSQINHHILISNTKIEELNKFGFEFKNDFKDKIELKKYFYQEIKKQKNEIKNKIGKNNFYEDLRFQIDSIQKLENVDLKEKNKKNNKIIIERELDPLKSIMMGNWVNGSCLSFESDVGNYYSALTNSVDVNKAVFYIKNEYGDILGRCLMTIGNDKKLSRYKMYYSGFALELIDNAFDSYTIDLSKNMGIELNGNQSEVLLIEGEAWYKDGIKYIKNTF